MSKIRRNDPCPCGSGKKYKKCCLSDDIEQVNEQKINNELYQLHHSLINEMTTNYERTIEDELAHFTKKPFYKELDDASKDIYKTGLIPWIMSSVPTLKREKTILQRFYLARQSGLSAHTRKLFLKWTEARPSIYIVESINEATKFITIRSLDKQNTYTIPFAETDDFILGSFVIGTVIPFANHENFLMTVVKLYDRDVAEFEALVDAYQTKDLKEAFPSFLAEALSSNSVESDWAYESYAEVADLLVTRLAERDVSDQVIIEAIQTWRTFCEIAEPTIQRIQAYAAAMDYYIQKVILKSDDVTQAAIAESYETSASSLSTNYRRIEQTLEETK